MKSPITAKQFFLTLNITYYMQAFAVLAFALVVYFISLQNESAPVGDVNTWMYIVIIVLISALVMAYFIFRLLVGRIQSSMKLQEKMPRYARALFVRSALIEIPGLLAAIASIITGNPQFLAVPMVIVVLFAILRPTKNSIAMDLNLSTKEKNALDDENAVVSEVNR